MTPETPTIDTRPSPSAWAATYVPFGVGLAVALLGAEITQDLRLFRAINTIRLSMGLSIVALVLFPHRRRSQGLLNIWRLTWTFGLLAYLIHFAYAWWGVFGGQVATANEYPTTYGFPAGAHPTTFDLIVQHQGIEVLLSNLIVTAVWSVDALLAWTAGRAKGGLARVVSGFHVFAWLDVLISFVVATLVFPKNQVSTALGYLLVAATAISLLTWGIGRKKALALEIQA